MTIALYRIPVIISHQFGSGLFLQVPWSKQQLLHRGAGCSPLQSRQQLLQCGPDSSCRSRQQLLHRGAGCSPLHAQHHWYPDIDLMKQFEGKVILYDEHPPEGSLAAEVTTDQESILGPGLLDNWDKIPPEKHVRWMSSMYTGAMIICPFPS